MLRMRMEGPVPNGENKISTLEIIPTPEGYKELVYVVHPSTINGDKKFLVQQPIQEYVDNQTVGKRVVLIAPPQKCIYLKPGTKVTDVRSDSFDLDWVKSDDIKDEVAQITLIGGNLEKCLGSVFQSIFFQNINWISVHEKTEKKELAHKEIRINLPLEAIYTIRDTSAQTILSLLKSRESASELEAIVALFTSGDNDTKYNRDFEIITSDARVPYVISINGRLIAKLTPLTEYSSYRECYLNITFTDLSPGGVGHLSEFENQLLEAKIEYAKKVLVGYSVKQNLSSIS